MKIHWDEESHLAEFVALNNAWIERYFQLEEFDHELAKNPSRIVQNGGHILSITDNDEVIGVCALFRESDDTFELARMSVIETKQRKGIGRRLMQEILEFSKNNGIKKLFLISNTKMKPAISLYKSFNFQTVFEGQHPDYKRGNIVMEKSFHAN